MIFDDNFLDKLRETGINSHNLKQMVLMLAVKIQRLEKELKHGNTDTQSDPQSADKAIS